MKVGIVPTKYGYSAVALPPYRGDWELRSPVKLTDEQKIILRGQILHQLAIYAHQMTPWTGLLLTAFLWMIFGGIALYLRLSNYVDIGGWKMIALYGWIMFLFFGDGLWAFSRTVHQARNLFHAWFIRNKLAKGKWVEKDCPWDIRLTWSRVEMTERECIDWYVDREVTFRAYYKEMLRTEPPLAFSAWPLGLLGTIRYLFQGIRFYRPAIVVEMGRLG